MKVKQESFTNSPFFNSPFKLVKRSKGNWADSQGQPVEYKNFGTSYNKSHSFAFTKIAGKDAGLSFDDRGATKLGLTICMQELKGFLFPF